MTKNDSVVAVFPDHRAIETAIRKLGEEGIDIKHFSIVGKGYHTEEKVVGFYNAGDRIKFWGQNGAIWGGFWGLFVGGLFMTVPMVGSVVVLGHLAAMVLGAIEGAVIVGGLSALGAAMFGLGIPEDSVIKYEQALQANEFLLVAHGTPEIMARAKTVLDTTHPISLDLHQDVKEMPALPGGHSTYPAAA